jgi:hypothetical protein
LEDLRELVGVVGQADLDVDVADGIHVLTQAGQEERLEAFRTDADKAVCG